MHVTKILEKIYYLLKYGKDLDEKKLMHCNFFWPAQPVSLQREIPSLASAVLFHGYYRCRMKRKLADDQNVCNQKIDSFSWLYALISFLLSRGMSLDLKPMVIFLYNHNWMCRLYNFHFLLFRWWCWDRITESALPCIVGSIQVRDRGSRKFCTEKHWNDPDYQGEPPIDKKQQFFFWLFITPPCAVPSIDRTLRVPQRKLLL